MENLVIVETEETGLCAACKEHATIMQDWIDGELVEEYSNCCEAAIITER